MQEMGCEVKMGERWEIRDERREEMNLVRSVKYVLWNQQR